MHARGDSQLAERLQEMNRLWRAWRSRCRKVQVTLKQNASFRDEGHHHRIDMRRAGQRVELQRLLALTEHVFPVEQREAADLSASGPVGVEHIRGVGMARFQEGTDRLLVTAGHEK